MSKNENIEAAYKQQSNRLLNYIRKYLPSGDAEDVLHDVFTQLFVGYDQLRAIENTSAWLFKTAMNKIIDLKRKKKPLLFADKNNVSDEEGQNLMLEDILPTPSDSPEDELFREAIWETISGTLDELPPEQSEVFVLHEFEDRSFKEIEKITGEKVNTLISRKRYAILALRERLAELYELLN